MISSPIEELRDSALSQYNVRILVKRDDLIHPVISGNKWRKLKYNLMVARRQRCDTILTFGGPFSNHLHAVAAAGRVCGFNTIGVVRGAAMVEDSPTLTDARRYGMRLYFVDRATYRKKDTEPLLAQLRQRFGRFFLLPEGGSNTLALAGCGELAQEIVDQVGEPPAAVLTACGSGATLAGLAANLPAQTQAIGVSVLKGERFMAEAVERLLREAAVPAASPWRVLTEYHHGGYAKVSPELAEFVSRFGNETGIPIEPVYTGKMFYALYDLVRRGHFPSGSTVVAVHTGGLQGLRGMTQKLASFESRASRSDAQPA